MLDLNAPGIYKITSTLEPDKFYIGSAETPRKRRNQHKSMLKLGNHFATYMQRYFNKHGMTYFKFEIVENCHLEELEQREQYYIDSLKPPFNSRKLANSNRGHRFSDDAKKNMSASQRRWRVGRDLSVKLTPEIKAEAIRLNQEGFKRGEIASILKISLPTATKAIKSVSSYKFKLTPDNVLEIRRLINDGSIPIKDIAVMFNVAASVISNIKAGRLHKNIK